MEITGARTCAAAELVLQLESDWGHQNPIA